MNEFKKPFNVISLALAVIGILIGAYFYLVSKQYKQISYQIDETSSKIYDSKNTTSSLRVLGFDSIPIKENVYYIRGKLWNSGNLPIVKSDVRLPLSIQILSCKKILDYKIEKQYDTLQGFKLIKINNNTLEVDWKYFDPENGFTFQIIFLGDEIPNAKISGKLLSISEFVKVNEGTKDSLWLGILPLAIGFVWGLFADNIFPTIFGSKSKIKFGWRILMLAIVGALLTATIQFVLKGLFVPSIPF